MSAKLKVSKYVALHTVLLFRKSVLFSSITRKVSVYAQLVRRQTFDWKDIGVD